MKPRHGSDRVAPPLPPGLHSLEPASSEGLLSVCQDMQDDYCCTSDCVYNCLFKRTVQYQQKFTQTREVNALTERAGRAGIQGKEYTLVNSVTY